MIYLDSCLLIYLTEDAGQLSYAVRQRMNAEAEQSFAISPLVVMECLVGPIRAADTLLKARYDRIFRTFILLPTGLDVFEAAAELRAQSTASRLQTRYTSLQRCWEVVRPYGPMTSGWPGRPGALL